MLKHRAFLLFLLNLLSFQAFAHTVSPVEFGLLKAKTGEERYIALYNTHLYALSNNLAVNYSGLKNIYLTVPKGAKSIPLGYKTDFKGCSFYVLNNIEDGFVLFEINNQSKREIVDVDFKEDIHFSHPKQKGVGILVLTDEVPWVNERSGFGYSAIRKDVLLCRNGKIRTSSIVEYNEESRVHAEYIIQTESRKFFRNVHFIRDKRSTKKTLLLKAEGFYNLNISNIEVKTPDNDKLYGDDIIDIRDCVKIKLDKINIIGTYSLGDKYGYAFVLNNVSFCQIDGIKAEGRWGVFCCNNINGVNVKNSQINRFDLHCYGRDFTFKNCVFTKTGMPLSSFFGTLSFIDCIFDHAISIIYRTDYNAYTPFDVLYEHCTFVLDKKRNYLIDLVSVPEENNDRLDLSRKCLPNISLKNCLLSLESGFDKLYIVRGCPHNDNILFDYINNINIRNLISNQNGVSTHIFDAPIKSRNEIIINSNNHAFFTDKSYPVDIIY